MSSAGVMAARPGSLRGAFLCPDTAGERQPAVAVTTRFVWAHPCVTSFLVTFPTSRVVTITKKAVPGDIEIGPTATWRDALGALR